MTAAEKPVVAFVGLGRMGLPMASRLAAAGFSVRGADVSAAAREAFASRGEVFEDARAAADGSDVLIAMLPDGAAVREAVTRAIPALPSGALVIDMSSSAPADTVALGRDLAARGLRLIDAPVSGGVVKAAEGTLAIMAGGAEEDVAQARPILEVLGTRIFETGPLGAGHAMKALNNYVSAAGLAAAAEALVIGARYGLDPEVATDVLNASTGRNNTTEVKLKRFMISGRYDSGFSLALMAKDLAAAAEMAREAGLDAAFAGTVAELWAEARAALPDDADHTELHRWVSDRAQD